MLRIRKIVFSGSLLVLVSLVFACKDRQCNPPAKQATTPKTDKLESLTKTTLSFSDASEGTRLALIQACGRCHQSTLATHKPKAIAIFDLDQGEQWHNNLAEKNLEGMARRAKNNDAISKEELALINAFISQKRTQLQ